MTKAMVLIVDDDPALLQALPEALRLRLEGVSIDVAESAVAALRRIAMTDYDAIICDIKMPGMDGLALLAEIRKLKPDTPTLLITGHGEHDLAVQALRGGAYDLIQKPIDRDYFLASLERAIQLRQLRREVQRQREALEWHASQLERTVAERTKQLLNANAAKDRFLAVLSHELRNPLASIHGATELLRRCTDSDPTLQEVAEVIGRNVDLQIRLVNDLLDLSRLALGKVQLVSQPLRLDGITAAVAAQMSARAQEAGIRLRLSAEPYLWVNGDPARLEQVLSNLLGNAIKFTPPGGEVTVAVTRCGDTVRVVVRDTGIGMEQGEIASLFELFQQGEQTEIRQPGLGIGLAVARQLVELQGGTIRAESEGRGRGSTFSIELPGAEPPADTCERVLHQAQGQHLRVLLVDDNTDSVTFLARILRMEGWTITVAYSAEEALELLAGQEPPDVIVADLGLPGMDGREMLRCLRLLPGYAQVPALVLSGYGEEADIQASLEAGFRDHLVKPFDVDALIERILEVAE